MENKFVLHTVHCLPVHAIDPLILVDGVHKPSVWMLNLSDLVVVVDKEAELFEACRKDRVLRQAAR